MIIALTNLHASVLSSTDAEDRMLRSYLSFEAPGAAYSLAARSGHWDGKIHLWNEVTRTFPAGLVPLVKKEATRRAWTVDVVDKRTRVEPTGPDAAWLRDYQQEAVATCLRRGRGVVWAATGSGKTEMFVALGRKIPCRWLVLTHTADLLHQTAERWRLRVPDEEPGLVGDGLWSPQRWTVATMQTLVRGLRVPRIRQLLLEAEGIAIDETHVAPANSFWKVIMSTPNAYWRFGFSGTPLARGDKRNAFVIAATGPVIHRVSAQHLVEKGILSKPRIKIVELRQSGLSGDWREVYALGVTESLRRNALVTAVAVAAAKPSLLFTKEIAHGRTLCRSLERQGLRVEFVFGDDTSGERAGAIRRLRRGDIETLITSPIFEQGVDIPEVRSVVVAGGGRSVIRTLQRLGRGMRKTAEKDEMELWDFRDTGHRWLTKHSEERLGAYVSEGFETTEVSASEVALRVAKTTSSRE